MAWLFLFIPTVCSLKWILTFEQPVFPYVNSHKKTPVEIHFII